MTGAHARSSDNGPGDLTGVSCIRESFRQRRLPEAFRHRFRAADGVRDAGRANLSLERRRGQRQAACEDANGEYPPS